MYALFQTILGNKSLQLEKERQEYLIAFLQKKGILQALKNLKKEQALLEQTYSSQFNVEYQLEKLLAQKEKLLLDTDHPLASSILAANKRMVNHQNKIKEIRQAVTEGKHTKKVLHNMIFDLNQVVDWDNYF